MDWSKFTSRKFLLTQEILLALIGLPILMTKSGVPTEVQIISLVGILAIAVSYQIANVKDSMPVSLKQVETNLSTSVTSAVQETIRELKPGSS